MPELLDSRRLTGPNLYGRSPGAVVTLGFDDGEDPAAFIDRWRGELGRGLARLGWSADFHVRCWKSESGRAGAELMFTAGVDRLYAATDLNEWAVARAGGEPEPDGALADIEASARSEQAPRRGLVELLDAADARGVPWLLDDDEVSLGYFDRCVRWRIGSELPGPDAVDWSQFDSKTQAVALITGTNGKTTTTRLLARIARIAGLHVGNTSTDGLYVDERIVEAGDWTGPGGARAVLRNGDVQIALLEAARGGLLRRGAGVRSAAVAVITNIAHDHLGEYGIVDLDGMAAAKGIVATIVEPQGRVVLGADSPALVAWAQARQLPAPIAWFSLDPTHPVLTQAQSRGAEVWTLLDGDIVRTTGSQTVRLCRADELPISLGGLARHNVANALAAAAAAHGLGFDDATITAGLREFGARADDNPGRARMCELARPAGGRVRVLLDFAHNLAGVAAITELVRGLERGAGDRRTIVCFGMPGDRSDEDLRTIAAALISLEPREVILRELPDYARGRDPAEVPRLLEQGLRAVSDVAIRHARGEVDSLALALGHAEAGELVIMLVHTERDEVDAWLREHEAVSLI